MRLTNVMMFVCLLLLVGLVPALLQFGQALGWRSGGLGFTVLLLVLAGAAGFQSRKG